MEKKILVVDDEPHIIRLIQTQLERENYAIVTAFDGQTALEMVEVEQPGLIILDTMMPIMDGFEALQNLKKNPVTRSIPVLMLTAKRPDADIFRGWDNGADCYLCKPFAPAELLAYLRRIFRADAAEDGDKRIRIG